MDPTVGLDTGELSDDPERRSQDGGSNEQQGISPESEEMQVEGVEKGLRGAKNLMAKRISFSAVIHVNETTPHLHCDFYCR